MNKRKTGLNCSDRFTFSGFFNSRIFPPVNQNSAVRRAVYQKIDNHIQCQLQVRHPPPYAALKIIVAAIMDTVK